MTGLKDLTATELAAALDGGPHSTGSLSMLDEATLAFGWKYPAVSAAQRAFGAARLAHMGSYSDEAWASAISAARTLARALRTLGDTRIPRCKQPVGWGPCDLALDEDGTCPGRRDHV